MEVVYSDHALARMVERAITGEVIQRILSSPDTLIEGPTADEYTARIGGVPVRVILARNTEPRLVVTVYEVEQ